MDGPYKDKDQKKPGCLPPLSRLLMSQKGFFSVFPCCMISKNLLTCHWLHSSVFLLQSRGFGLALYQHNWHPTSCFWEAACGQTETASMSWGGDYSWTRNSFISPQVRLKAVMASSPKNSTLNTRLNYRITPQWLFCRTYRIKNIMSVCSNIFL